MRAAAEFAMLAIKMLPKRLFARLTARTVGTILVWAGRRVWRGKVSDRHLLILRSKYYSKESSQPSTEVMHLDQTLRASGLATFDVLTYDGDLYLSPISDLQLIYKCLRLRPHAVVLSSWWHAPTHPSIDSIRIIREKLGIPFAAIWWDTCSESFWRSLEPVKMEFDAHVIVDNPCLYFIDPNDPVFGRVLNLWVPEDESTFKPSRVKDVPVSFLGQVSSYRSYRSETIQHLMDMNVPGYFSTQERKSQVTHAEYANIMGRSKMSLNFSASVSCHQVKSRVWEVLLSGAMLLESANEQTSTVLTPMKDYVPFNSKEDLLEKICYYLEHEGERAAIAAQGRATVLAQYNSLRFWQLVFDKLMLRST